MRCVHLVPLHNYCADCEKEAVVKIDSNLQPSQIFDNREWLALNEKQDATFVPFITNND